MRPALWAFGTAASVLALASACTGWGDPPDPGAPSSETISNILQIPNGATLDHVGHVVAENSILYAAAASQGEQYDSSTQWVLRKEGDGAWAKVWTSKSSTDPRLLASNGTLYWASRDGSEAKIRRWSPGDAEPHDLCNLSSGNPAGLTQWGDSLYVFQLSSSTCAYSFSSEAFCDDNDTNATLLACPKSQQEAGAVGVADLLTGRPLISNQLVNAIVAQDKSLYWFEGKEGADTYRGATLMRLGLEGNEGGGNEPQETKMVLDSESYPVGFAFSNADLYVATSAVVDEVTPSFSGCIIWRLTPGDEKPERMMTDQDRTCRGLSADPSAVWFTTAWLEGQENREREGVIGLPKTSNLFPSAFVVDRPGIGLRETIRFNDSVLVASRAGLLKIRASLVP